MADRFILQAANPDIDIANDPQTVWEIGSGGVYTFPSAAETLDVVSTSTNDTSAGTGARTIKIKGLDSDYKQIEETISMNGTTTVTSTQSFLRVNEAFCLTAGSNGTNAGDISIDNNSSGDNLDFISTGIGRGRTGVFTVPDDRRLNIESISASPFLVGGAAEIQLRTKEPTNNAIVVLDTLYVQDSLVRNYGSGGLDITEKLDLEIHAYQVGTDNYRLQVSLYGWLY